MKKLPVCHTGTLYQHVLSEESTGIVANTVANIIAALLMYQLPTRLVQFMTQFPVILLIDLSFPTLSGHAHIDCQRYDMACHEVASSVAENFQEVSCAECIGQGNDIELLQMVKMETRYLIEGYLGNEFPTICNYCGVMTV